LKKIVSISLGPSRLDYQFEAELWGERFHIRRVGCDGDTDSARQLVREHDGQVDCIALGGMAISFRVGERTWHHKETWRIASAARTTPVVGGRALKRIVDRWAIREIARQQPELFDGANVLFLSGIANYDAVEVMREFTDSMTFADPVLHYGVPAVLPDRRRLEAYARVAMPFLTRRPYVSFFPRGRAAEGIQQRELMRFFLQADVVVGDLRLLMHYAPKDMPHKVVITDTIDDEALEIFRQRGVEVLCTTTPEVFPGRRVDLQILHALAVAHLQKDPRQIDEQDYLDLASRMSGRPRVIHPQGEVRRRKKFAWLYYPPGRRDLFRSPRMRWLRAMPVEVQATVERAAARLPITPHAHVRGIVSPTGEEAEGWILRLPATAQQISQRGPEFAQRRLREAAELASSLGAEVLGVGAFSREMTRATVPVAARVDIPITSGASCLVSTDMWAAKRAVLAMGIEQDEIGRAMGTALVLGAGDAQGAAAAELLALVFQRLVVVDRSPDRLLNLLTRIGARSPHCKVEVATRAETHLPQADLVVTGLAPDWRGAVRLEALKTGAVLADCSRPQEFGVADADERPDVLILLAGELELPGPADVGADLGPPPKTAFSSMAEVVILALEGRRDCFTLGDEVELEQVKEIYKLGMKHGLVLAGMRGVRGPLLDTEVKLVRERAESRRRRQEAPPPLETTEMATLSDEEIGE
jgi:predicted amino acid dehydrogenase